jgi:hypothetical protein
VAFMEFGGHSVAGDVRGQDILEECLSKWLGGRLRKGGSSSLVAVEVA